MITNPNAGLLDGAVRLYRVHGICFVPTECSMIVSAESPEKAVHLALNSDWKQHIDQNSGDDRSAFDWMPFAEELQSPNAPTLAGPAEPPACGNRDTTARNEDAQTAGSAESPNAPAQPPGEKGAL